VFNQGQTVALTGAFTSAAGEPVDPDTVTVTVVRPDGSRIQPDVIRDDTGSYHAEIVADVADRDQLWRWRMDGAGGAAQVEFGSFKVLPAPVPSEPTTP